MSQTSPSLPRSTFEEHFVKPQYGGSNFADLPAFIRATLLSDADSPIDTIGQFNHVALVFIDAFGWHFFQRYVDHYPFLQRFTRHGSATRLTSQFPSTTSAHVTTLFTGRPVGQHGVYEWHYYEPTLDAMITPLPFTFTGDKEPEKLRAAGVRPETILPPNDFIQGLLAAGVDCFISQPGLFSQSSYSQMISRGAQVLPYTTQAEAQVNLSRAMDRTDGPGLFSLYLPQIDAICHEYGPDSLQFEVEIEACFFQLEQWFRREQARSRSDTLLMVIADHGQTAVDPETTIYLNQHPQFDRLLPLLRTNGQGQVLAPAGSARDMFLYIREGYEADAQALLSDWLAGRAAVVQTAELMAEGYFGPAPLSRTFRNRVGNLVILPFAGETVWWYEKDRFDMKFYGHHGGLSADEMEIPLLLVAFD